MLNILILINLTNSMRITNGFRKTQEIKNLRPLVNKLRKNKKVCAIILFGSYAKNKATPISDLDICIISKRLSEKEKTWIDACGSEKIQIVFFDELPLPVQFRVFKEGRVIYQRDQAFVNSLRAETISRFLDFKPILVNYFKKVFGWKYEI